MTSLARRSSSQYVFPFIRVQTVSSLIMSNRVRWSFAAVGFLCHYVYMSGSKHLDCLDLERRPRPSFLFCFFDAVVSFSSTKQVIWEQNPLRPQPSLDGNTPAESKCPPSGLLDCTLMEFRRTYCGLFTVKNVKSARAWDCRDISRSQTSSNNCNYTSIACAATFLCPDAVEYHFWPAWFK